VVTEERVLQIPIVNVVLSKENRRDAGDVKELAESIKAQGLLQPIVARVVNGKHEIICGERRYLACKSLGHATIACQLVEATDQEAAEMRTVENLQRKDLAPMESAEQIAALLDGRKSMQEIADALGKPVPWVAKRAKLMDLTTEWKEAVTTDQAPGWTPSMLELVARMNPEIQGELFERYIERGWGGTPTLDEIRDIAERGTFVLSSAKWKLDDSDLDEKAGACKNCTNRTGAQANLFDEYNSTKADDRCLDPECFKRKTAAFLAKRELELREKNPDLVLIGSSYEVENTESLKGKKILDQYAVNQAKKGEAGAVQALVVTGEKAGTVKWVKIPKGEKAKSVAGGGGEKSMKEKRAALEKRRARAFTQKVLDILNAEQDKPNLVKRLELSKAVAAISTFGADFFDHDGPPDWDNIKGNTMDDPQDLKDRLFVLVIPKWLRELDQDAKYSDDAGKPYALELLKFLEVPKAEIEKLEADIIDAIPEPKAWAAQEAAEKSSKKGAKKVKPKTDECPKDPEDHGTEERKCRVCGCTKDNACIVADDNGNRGASCYWVEPDLCSACALEEKPKRLSSKKKSKK